MNCGEAGRNRATSSEREEQAAGGNEISVETLEQTKNRRGKNKANGPLCARSVRKSGRGRESFAQNRLPRHGEGDGGNGDHIEGAPDKKR